MRCSDCGAEIPPGEKSCGFCHAAQPLVCGHCGFACGATARFCSGCGKPLQLAAPDTAGAGWAGAPGIGAAERRHLTVMFCDLVGSTPLSVRIDPEDLSDIFRQYQQACEQVIGRYGGYVARYSGDGLLAYFGYPSATEHDAERAVRAGLEIIEAVRTLRPGLALHTRIGIASGEVVVGEVVGEGASREVTVVGETPNLAARLQAMCTPDTVVISGDTHRLLGGLFEYADLGQCRLKGFDHPIRVYSVEKEAAVESRFEAFRGGRPGTLLGRERELRVLQECLRKASAGTRQLALICGEEGIGKSHLLESFRDSLEPHSVDVLRLYGSPHARGIVLHPVISHWRRIAGIEPSDPTRAKREKLKKRLEQLGFTSPGDLFLLATLLSIPVQEQNAERQMSPSALKSHTLELLVSLVTRRCQGSPVMLVVEDLHWLDSSSIEFLSRLMQQSERLPLLVIATCRPDFKPPWTHESEATTITMTHLDSAAARSLITRIAGEKALPETIVTDILDKTDGIPLFIEELTRTILEGPLLSERDDRFTLTGNVSGQSIPTTLQDSLMARLDRPGPAREIAQVGAALGREFRLDLLQAVVDQPAHVIDAALDELEAAQLVTGWGSPPHRAYRFRHNLIQETAYGSMLRSTRRQLHARIAGTLARRFRAQVQGRPDLLARHYTAAHLYEQGFRYWFLASQQALRHFAHKEVEVHLRRGLELAPGLPDDVELIVMEFEMRALLASTLMLLNGPGFASVGEAYQQAYDFCQGREGLLDSFPVRFGLCRHLWATGRAAAAVAEAESLLPLVDIEQDRGAFMAVHVLLGIGQWHRGESERALCYLQQVSACYREERDAGLFSVYMIDFGVFGRFYEALALLSLGRPDDAVAVAGECLSLARRLDNPHAIGFGITANLLVALFRGDLEQCVALADESIAFASAHGFSEFVAMAKVCLGSARLKSGLESGSLELMHEGVEQWEDTGFSTWQPLLRGMLAEAYLLLGQQQQAQSELAAARGLMELQDERQSARFLSAIERQLGRQGRTH